MSEADIAHMRRAIALAMRGRGGAEPNPMVGCVIVKSDRVIGEGYHQYFGSSHAEPNALAACTESPQGATVYVTLEPCCHTNKQTPPCAPRLIAAGVRRIVIGCLDPNPQVNGQGVAMLRQADIEVTAPLLEAQAKQLIAPFMARMRHNRPYVTLKWAQTADGKIAGSHGQRARISNAVSSHIVHQLRARCDAILIGVNTLLNDDPLLTAREVPPLRPLLRVVLDSDLKTPAESQLIRSTATGAVLLYGVDQNLAAPSPRAQELRRAGAEIKLLPAGPATRVRLQDVLTDLNHRRVTHVLVEPGPTLAEVFLKENLADRLWIFRSPHSMDDPAAPNAMPLPDGFIKTGEVNLAGDHLTEYLNSRSAVYFGPYPSADFLSISAPQSTENSPPPRAIDASSMPR